jgi:hypothetical protein
MGSPSRTIPIPDSDSIVRIPEKPWSMPSKHRSLNTPLPAPGRVGKRGDSTVFRWDYSVYVPAIDIRD